MLITPAIGSGCVVITSSLGSGVYSYLHHGLGGANSAIIGSGVS